MRGAIGLAAAALGILAGAARGSVDVEVPLNANVRGTLDPGETEILRFVATEGTALTVKIAAGGRAAIDSFSVALFDPAGDPVAVAPGFVSDLGRKYSILSFPLASDGTFRLEVAAAGSGEYRLSLKGKPRTAWQTTTNLGVEDLDLVYFSAPAGSRVKITARPVEGSGASPGLEQILGDQDFQQDLVETVRGTVHSAAGGPLDDDLSFSIYVRNAVGAPVGDVDVQTKVKAPRVKPAKLDVRNAVLGRPSGGETLVLRTVGTGGGTVSVGDSGSDLLGAAVAIPPGALDADVRVSVASADEPPLGSPDDQAAGPAVDLQPSGLTFDLPATVTLPFDFTKIPFGSDPGDIRIRIVEDDGTAVEVPPLSVNAGAGTVTVETSGFSICIPIILSGPPNLGYASDGTLRPGGDEYWFMEFSAEMFGNPSGDSRGRNLRAGFGQIAIHAGGTLDFSLVDHGFTWQNQDSTGGGNPIDSYRSEYSQADGGALTWAYDVSGRRIVLSGAPEALPTFRVSRDGRYLAGRHDGSTETYTEALFGVRKNAAPLTVSSLNGTWTAAFLDMDGGQTPSTGAAEPKLGRAYGTFTFDGAGGCRIAFTERETSFNASNGSFSQPTSSMNLTDPTYSIDGDGTILVVVPPPTPEESGTTLRLFAGAGLDVLLGGHDTLFGNEAMGLVLVRQGSGQSRSDLSGFYHGAEFGLDPQSYGGGNPTVNVADFSANDQGASGTFDGSATASVSFDDHRVRRGNPGVEGLTVENSVDSFSVGVAVTSQGRLTLTASEGSIVGAATPDGQFLMAVSNVGAANQDFAMFFMFRAPPDTTP